MLCDRQGLDGRGHRQNCMARGNTGRNKVNNIEKKRNKIQYEEKLPNLGRSLSQKSAQFLFI